MNNQVNNRAKATTETLYMIAAVVFMSTTAQFATSKLLTTNVSVVIAESGKRLGHIIPTYEHSRRFYHSSSTFHTTFGGNARVNLTPIRLPDDEPTGFFSLLNKSIYWECSPARYPLAAIFALIPLALCKWKARLSWAKSLLIVLICTSFTIGLMYPSVRLFWTGVQSSLIEHHKSKLNEVDSNVLLWMSSEIHNVIFLSSLLCLALLAHSASKLAQREFTHNPEAQPTTPRKKRNLKLTLVALLWITVAIGLSAPFSLAHTIGLAGCP